MDGYPDLFCRTRIDEVVDMLGSSLTAFCGTVAEKLRNIARYQIPLKNFYEKHPRCPLL